MAENANNSMSITKRFKVLYIFYLIIKRIFDIIFAIIGIILMIPITAVLWLIRLLLHENDGPMFYDHMRYGKNGKMFKIYKFRSMCMNADRVLEEYLEKNPKAKKEFDKTHKLQDDPRVTKLGDILRKTSLDELPQMFNILKGQLSFVGPRPVVDGELQKFYNEEEQKKFLSVTPGLTGYWQINGRSNTSYEERKKLELYYVDHQSLWLDFKILIKTFMVVLQKEGAV